MGRVVTTSLLALLTVGLAGGGLRAFLNYIGAGLSPGGLFLIPVLGMSCACLGRLSTARRSFWPGLALWAGLLLLGVGTCLMGCGLLESLFALAAGSLAALVMIVILNAYTHKPSNP